MNYSAASSADLLEQNRMQAAAPAGMSLMVGLLIGYMWLFIHRPFEVWPWLATYRPERVYMILVIICWLLLGVKRVVPNRLHLAFASFILAMLVSWLLSPYPDIGKMNGGEAVEDYLKYAVFYAILVTSVRDERDLRWIIVGHFGVLTLVMAHTLREFLCGQVGFDQGIHRLQATGSTFSDPNDFAGLVVCSLPFSWVLWREWNGWWKRLLLLGHFGLAGYCVMLTSSRMGFIGLVLAGLLATLSSPKRWRLIALYPVLLAAAWMVLPQDRKDRYFTLIDPSYGPKAAAASAGHLRYGGFETGLGVFDTSPFLGVGPRAFRMAAGSKTIPHNLYGELLSEHGLVGTIAFGLIIWGVAKNTLEARRIVRDAGVAGDSLAWRTILAASAAFLLLLIMGWGFNFLLWHVWLWFGGFQVVALGCLRDQAVFAEPIKVVESVRHVGSLKSDAVELF